MLQALLHKLRRQPSEEAPAPAEDPSLPLRPEGALPVHITADHGEVRLEDGQLSLFTDTDARTLRLDEVSMLALHGNITITTPCLHELLRRGIPVLFLTRGGYYLGQLGDASGAATQVRRAQYRAADDARQCLAIARQLVHAKLANARRLLRRRRGVPAAELRRLGRLQRKVARVRNLEKLRGLEGAAANLYWNAFPALVRAHGSPFVFEGRTRRPPRDAVNAALSYGYAVLASHCAAAALAAGLDAHAGFYHAERPGRPALALDLMEPFRPAVVDTAVLQAVNTGELGEDGFETNGDGSVLLAAEGRRALLAALEQRLSTSFTYPGTGRQLSWRAAISLHAQLLARALRNGETTFHQPVISGG